MDDKHFAGYGFKQHENGVPGIGRIPVRIALSSFWKAAERQDQRKGGCRLPKL
jgi:hypothetical protein